MDELRPEISSLRSSSAQQALWDDYVRAHPHGTPFHLIAWKGVIESSFTHEHKYLVATDRESGKIVGVLPLFLVQSRIFGVMLVSTPLATYGGILADSATVRALLIHRAQETAREYNVEFLEVRSFQNAVNDSSLVTKDLYVTFRQTLWNDPEKNYQTIPRKTRAEIRRGERNGLEFRVNEIGVDDFYSVYARSVRELGTPVFPKRLFANGMREFGSDCKIFSVHWKGLLVAAVWTLFHKDEVVPYYGGSIKQYNRLAVNNFMYWKLIKYGCEKGYALYDFGRSKKGTGSFGFKKRWGMEMMDLPYQYYLVRGRSMPDISPLNPKFSLGIRLWRRLPLVITNFLGPIISKHLV